MAATSVRAKRQRIQKLLTTTEISLFLVNMANLAISCAVSYYNFDVADRFMKSAAAFRSGDNATAAMLLTDAYTNNDRVDYYQGVRS
jgi:hypothetical protein